MATTYDRANRICFDFLYLHDVVTEDQLRSVIYNSYLNMLYGDDQMARNSTERHLEGLREMGIKSKPETNRVFAPRNTLSDTASLNERKWLSAWYYIYLMIQFGDDFSPLRALRLAEGGTKAGKDAKPAADSRFESFLFMLDGEIYSVNALYSSRCFRGGDGKFSPEKYGAQISALFEKEYLLRRGKIQNPRKAPVVEKMTQDMRQILIVRDTDQIRLIRNYCRERGRNFIEGAVFAVPDPDSVRDRFAVPEFAHYLAGSSAEGDPVFRKIRLDEYARACAQGGED